MIRQGWHFKWGRRQGYELVGLDKEGGEGPSRGLTQSLITQSRVMGKMPLGESRPDEGLQTDLKGGNPDWGKGFPTSPNNSLDSFLTFLAAQASRLVSNQNRRDKWHKHQVKELLVFTQAQYSYLFSGYRLQGTEKGIKPGLQTRE